MYLMSLWNHNVRTFLGSTFIVAYSFFALYASTNLNNQPQLSTKPPVTANAPGVQFIAQPNTPNPNTILSLVNQQRMAAGQTALIADARLEKIASARAADMVKRNYYGHRSPDGLYFYDVMKSNGLNANFSCENLDLMPSVSEQKAINDWLESTTGHKECLLNSTVGKAGYAATEFDQVFQEGKLTTLYVVVAIHTTN